MSALTVNDLTLLEQTYLGVLATGLVPADLAGDDRFRMEYVCALCHALRQGLPADAFTAESHVADAEFRKQLRETMIDLDQKRVIGIGPPQDTVILRPEVPPDAAYGAVDLNRHPPIFDRYLAQRCMDELLNHPDAYRLLMDLYAESGEVWRRLYDHGYGNHR